MDRMNEMDFMDGKGKVAFPSMKSISSLSSIYP
jgi:hypothetical protein